MVQILLLRGLQVGSELYTSAPFSVWTPIAHLLNGQSCSWYTPTKCSQKAVRGQCRFWPEQNSTASPCTEWSKSCVPQWRQTEGAHGSRRWPFVIQKMTSRQKPTLSWCPFLGLLVSPNVRRQKPFYYDLKGGSIGPICLWSSLPSRSVWALYLSLGIIPGSKWGPDSKLVCKTHYNTFLEH